MGTPFLMGRSLDARDGLTTLGVYVDHGVVRPPVITIMTIPCRLHMVRSHLQLWKLLPRFERGIGLPLGELFVYDEEG